MGTIIPGCRLQLELILGTQMRYINYPLIIAACTRIARCKVPIHEIKRISVIDLKSKITIAQEVNQVYSHGCFRQA
jgi:hypothetical protein